MASQLANRLAWQLLPLGTILLAQEVDMSHTQETIEGTISSKHQITIPAAMRDALGLRPGDKIEFRLETGNVLELRVKRPKPSETIANDANHVSRSRTSCVRC